MFVRLTERKVAEELKSNVEGLRKAGIEPLKSDLIYIKLAQIEDMQEMKQAILEARMRQVRSLSGKRAGQVITDEGEQGNDKQEDKARGV